MSVMIEKERSRHTIITPRTIRAGVYGGRDPAENLEHSDTKGIEERGTEEGMIRAADGGGVNAGSVSSERRVVLGSFIITRRPRDSHSD